MFDGLDHSVGDLLDLLPRNVPFYFSMRREADGAFKFDVCVSGPVNRTAVMDAESPAAAVVMLRERMKNQEAPNA